VNKTYLLLLYTLNLLLGTLFIITFDPKTSIVYAQQLDTNDTETLISTSANATKANATEGAATKANATEGAATKANATEGAATKANLIKTDADKELKYCYKFQFGSLGTDDGQFNRPHDIVLDSKGFLYINDRELNTFQKFSPDGRFISEFGEEGEKLGQYKSPYSMAMDSNDKIYVLDRGNDRVVKVDTEGNVLGALYSFNGPWITNDDDDDDEDDDNISENRDDTGFASPEAMAIDKHGNFYLTDTGNDRVIKFDKNFKYVSQFGQEGKGPGQFDHPHGIGIDSKGNIYINTLNEPRIQKFTNNGKFIKEWGTNGTGPGQLTTPLEHLKVDSKDRVFIVDSASNPRVQVFDSDGKLLTQFGKVGVGNGEFKKPEHVAFNEKDGKGTVYVVDRGNHRIQVLVPC
jgi:DNA-binding beta-propeller fold protein YncE